MSRTNQPKQAPPSPLSQRPEIRLPELHALQREVFDSEARFKIVACGRQWGKTSLGAALCVTEAWRKGRVWWVGPTYPIGQLGWDIIDRLCRQIPGTRFEGRPTYKITLPTGGTIQLRSADNPDSLRGATLTGVVFDEAALAKPEAWPYLRPTLSVLKGWALFISTPKGLNWFHELYEDAAERNTWERWTFPSVTSPYINAEDIEEARAGMSALLFSQEYEAEFISYGTGMFHSDWIQHWQHAGTAEQEAFRLGEEIVLAQTCRFFHTIDLAWSLEEKADYTVISSWAVTPKRHLILRDVIRGRFEGPDIIPKMRQAFERWGGVLYVETSSRQMQIIVEAERQGLPIQTVKADKDKISRALPATARMERGSVWFPPASTPWWPEVEEEVLAFPAGRHDDFVDTLSYAVMQIARGSAYGDHAPITG